MDAVAVEVAIEARSACSDRARAQAALASALASARAPSQGRDSRPWTVALVVDDGRDGVRSAAATILDDRGAVVAERTVTDRSARTCLPFARAVGAWASLVLDDELARARDAADTTDASPPSPPPRSTTSSPSTNPPVQASAATRENDLVARDRDEAPAPSTTRTIEIGMMGYLRDGLAGSAGFAGASPFVTIEVERSWFLRPSMALGTSTGGDAAFWHAGARLDFCRRIPGNYIERRGLELDLCLGAEGSDVVGKSASALRMATGPSASFRGELGANTSLELRLAGGYNFERQALDKEERAAPVYSEIDLGVSWRFR